MTRKVFAVVAVVSAAVVVWAIVTGAFSGPDQSVTVVPDQPAEDAPTEATPASCNPADIPNMPLDEAEACLEQIAIERGFDVDPQHSAFTVSYQACSGFTVEEITREFRTRPNQSDAALGYAQDLFTPEAQQAAFEGCLLA